MVESLTLHTRTCPHRTERQIQWLLTTQRTQRTRLEPTTIWGAGPDVRLHGNRLRDGQLQPRVSLRGRTRTSPRRKTSRRTTLAHPPAGNGRPLLSVQHGFARNHCRNGRKRTTLERHPANHPGLRRRGCAGCTQCRIRYRRSPPCMQDRQYRVADHQISLHDGAFPPLTAPAELPPSLRCRSAGRPGGQSPRRPGRRSRCRRHRARACRPYRLPQSRGSC